MFALLGPTWNHIISVILCISICERCCNFYCEAAAEGSKWGKLPNHLEEDDQTLDLASWQSQ